MNDQDFTTCRCDHCSGSIEFPTYGAGESVLCPHCGIPTVLRLANFSMPVMPEPQESKFINEESVNQPTAEHLTEDPSLQHKPNKIPGTVHYEPIPIGFIILCIGAAIVYRYFFTFEASIKTKEYNPYGPDKEISTYNIGLLNERQNGILIGIGTSIIGVILMTHNRR